MSQTAEVPSVRETLDGVRLPDGTYAPEARDLARDLLTFGHVDGDLWPGPGGIDPGCADESLSTARAIVAIELRRSALLTQVVAKHLASLRGDFAAAGRWLDPILRDEAGQCLLAVGLLADGSPQALYRDFLMIDNDAWPLGPLGTLRQLGIMLRDRDPGSIESFVESVKTWPGWSAADSWPIRLPGDGLDGLKRRAADFVADALDLGESKLWKRGTAIEAAITAWPSLEAFCWGTAPAAADRGGRS